MNKIFKSRLLFISFVLCSAVFGQSDSYGNTFILVGGEFTIQGENNFQRNGSVNSGISSSNRLRLGGFMSFTPNFSLINSSKKVHLDGNVRTYHSDLIIFPIGHKPKWRLAGVSGSSVVSPLVEVYCSINPSEAELTHVKEYTSFSIYEIR